MGYYPATLYYTGGLASQADNVDWGGEVVDGSDHPEPTATWMGSGRLPVGGFGSSAYIRNLQYQSDPNGGMTDFQAFPTMTNPASYGIAADFSGATTWGSYFYWGGSGGI
jgi:hypothetical protein